VFRKTARNFNVPAATCGKVCVVEVEEIVPLGSSTPTHPPARRLCPAHDRGAPYDKRIEFRTVRKKGRPHDGIAKGWTATRWPPAPRRNCRTASTSTSASASRRWWRTISPKGVDVTLQSENGMLGMGPFPYEGEEDPT
jgi:hypothetical protein